MQTRGLIPEGTGTGLDLVYTSSGGGSSPLARALGHWRRHWRRCGLLVPACVGTRHWLCVPPGGGRGGCGVPAWRDAHWSREMLRRAGARDLLGVIPAWRGRRENFAGRGDG